MPVLNVLASSHPFEVSADAVRARAVDVVDLVLSRWRLADERERDQSVDIDLLPAATARIKVHCGVPGLALDGWFQQSVYARVRAGRDAPDPPEGADFVEGFVADNRTPFLAGQCCFRQRRLGEVVRLHVLAYTGATIAASRKVCGILSALEGELMKRLRLAALRARLGGRLIEHVEPPIRRVTGAGVKSTAPLHCT